MKVIVTNTRTITIDLEQERQRIMDLFDNPIYIDSLIGVIDAFEKDGYDKALELYFGLPYNEEDEYPLQESMGKWWSQVGGDDFLWDNNVENERKMEIIKH